MTALKEIKPDIIYVQQSGMGAQGTYGRFRTVGPIANAFAGLSEMSGLPEPAMPAGWGYSYLDWMGAYSFALAMLSALFHRERTGEGQWIDASQTEVGLFINGPAILDWSANERIWTRYRQPVAVQTRGAARRRIHARATIAGSAIACFTDAEWNAFVKVAAHPEWATDSALCDACCTARASGRARRAGARLDEIARRLSADARSAGRPACRPACARPRATAATAIRN